MTSLHTPSYLQFEMNWNFKTKFNLERKAWVWASIAIINLYSLVMMTVLLMLTATHTRQAVFEVDEERGLTLVEVAEGVSTEDVTVATGCPFEVCPNICSYTTYLIPLSFGLGKMYSC